MQPQLSTVPSSAVPYARAKDEKAGAGVMFVTRDGKALLMRRNGGGDHRGEWAFPGGHAEGDETPLLTATREAGEEVGQPGKAIKSPRYLGSTAGHGIEFHTFAAGTPAEFQPVLNDEHDGAGWFPLNQLPSPLHPGVAETLTARLGYSTDMSESDWDGLRTGLNKWLDEEAAEPAHAEDAKKFEEEKHPRDKGKFAHVAGAGKIDAFTRDDVLRSVDSVISDPERAKRLAAKLDGKTVSSREELEGIVDSVFGSSTASGEIAHALAWSNGLNSQKKAPGPSAEELEAPATVPSVNRALKSIGAKEKLVSGGSYYYFVDGDAADWPRSSIYVYRINQMSLGEVLDEYKSLRKEAGGPALDKAIETLALDRSSARTFDKNGHMIVSRTPVTKANVCEYYGREIPDSESLGLDPNRRYRLLRHPDEIAKAAPSWNGKPLLIIHKPVNAGDHPRELVVGSVGTDAEFTAPYLFNSLSVWDKEAIDAIESGKQRELSSAYHYRADMTPGVFDGQAYDGVMRDLHANHVALVRDGRAGSDVVVQDSVPAFHWTFGAFTMSTPAAPRYAFDAFEESKHPRDHGKFAAGVGKSHAEHAEHHEKRADEHAAAAKKHAGLANSASFGGGDLASSLKHREAESAHRAAEEEHVDAANEHHHAHEKKDAAVSESAHRASKEAHEASQKADAPGTKPEDWKRVKRMRSHTDHARFLAETEEEPAGYVANHHSAHIPSPYAHSPSHTVYKHKGKNVLVKETAHKQFDVHEVPAGVKIHPTHEAAEEEYVDHLKKNRPSFWKTGSQDANPFAAFDATFEESKHPRANNGQFGAGEGKSHESHMSHHGIMSRGLRQQIASTKPKMADHVAAAKEAAAEKHEDAAEAHRQFGLKGKGGSSTITAEGAHAASKAAHEATTHAHHAEMSDSFMRGAQEHIDEAAKHAKAGDHGTMRDHLEAAQAHTDASSAHRVASNHHSDPTSTSVERANAAGEKARAASKNVGRKDELTKKNTAFKSFHEMANAEGGYRPSMHVDQPHMKELADHYDKHQESRGDPRRAFRYGKSVDKPKRPTVANPHTEHDDVIDKAHAHFEAKHGKIDRGAVEAHLAGGDHPEHKTLMGKLPKDYGGEQEELTEHFGLSKQDVGKIIG